jgi:hypothetical protein
MKRREFIRLVGGCGARVTAFGACSRASPCDTIGVLMPHTLKTIRSDLLVSQRCCSSWSYSAGPLVGAWRLMFAWRARDGGRQE